ncbi:MAG: sialidase family protein [Bacteroidales bacterium]
MKKILFFIGIAHFLVIHTFADNPTKIVGIPPADGGRGLIRVDNSEIRHYSGGKGRESLKILVSKDNGLTWNNMNVPTNYPDNFGGIPKESPAISQNPLTGEFIRVQPAGGYVFISQGGLDGKWGAVTKDGKLSFDWMNNDGHNYVKLSGIMRNPVFVNEGKRILIPAHSGSSFVHISDDGGLTWTRSKNNIEAPPHKAGGIHKGHRWQNIGVEGTIVELKNKTLWILVRTSQDQYYEAFSEDMGETWSAAKPSRFWGTLTMPCINRLSDGRLLMLWTNTVPLPENKGANLRGGEDAFTNRDSHHAAISHDDGNTWIGFREIILDEHRNQSDYATFNGSEDRGKHQSEMVQLDKDHVLISLGQHKEHRKLVIYDTRSLYEKKRSCTFEDGLDKWTIHTYIPQTKGHCAYNRKPSASLIDYNGQPAMLVKRLEDADLISESLDVNYEKGGATWNFPNGIKGSLSVTFTMNKGSEGTQISLTDRLFNACDETVEKLAVYTLTLRPGMKLGNKKLKAGKSYNLTFKWNGVNDTTSLCYVYLDNSPKPVICLPLVNSSPNGLSYLHLISKAEKADTGTIIEAVEAHVIN